MHKIKFILKNIVNLILFCIFLMIFIFSLSNMENINNTILISVGVFIILLFIILDFMCNYNFSNPLCNYEITASVIKIDSIYHEGSDTPAFSLDNNISDLITIEYLYKRKKYKKSILLFTSDGIIINRGKVKIKICKFLPRMVNIIREISK